MLIDRHNFNFLVNSGDKQKDESEIEEFLKVINRDFAEVFDPAMKTDVVFDVPWTFMRAVTNGKNNTYIRRLKKYENAMRMNPNGESAFEYHVDMITSEARSKAGVSIVRYINILDKILKYMANHLDRKGRMSWNIVYYQGVLGVEGKNGIITGGDLFK